MKDKIEIYFALNNAFNRLIFFTDLSFWNIFRRYNKIIFRHDKYIRSLISYYEIETTGDIYNFEEYVSFLFGVLKKEFDSSKSFYYQKADKNKGFELYLLENGIINSDHLSFFDSKSIDFVFFHGSVGDRSFKDGISDVDVVFGFNQKLIKSYNSFSEFILKLYNYNFHLFKVDSLQHHGILSFFNFQTTSYLKHYLPEELIKHGETLKAKFSPSSVESKRLEKNALRTMINDSIVLNRRIFLGNYKQKALYSTILMIYIYKIQLVEGVYGFKPHILDLVYKNSNITEKTILDKLSFFRLNFKYKSKISGILKYFTDYPLLYKYLLIFEGTFRYFFSKRILFHLKNRGEFEFFLISTNNELELIDG